jgi:type VI secretion system secreted protein VgrG
MGNNELSFEDAAGREQIYVHAQRDLDEVVERNHTARVKGDEATRIEGSRREDVAGNTSESVGGRAERRIASDETTQVDGNRIDVVTGNADYRVSGMVTKRIEGRELRDVQESADLRYADDLTTRVRGCHTTLVGRADAKRSYLVHVEGVSTLSSIERMEISSEEELVLRVGKSAIRITSDRIELCSPQIGAKGDGGGLSIADDGLSVRSKGEAQFLADKMLFKTEAASIAMGKEMKVDAEKVLLNSPEQATDAPPKEPSKTTTIELVDTDGNPLAYQRYLLVLDDGSEQSGVLDKDGRAEVDVEASGTILFPDLSEVEPG